MDTEQFFGPPMTTGGLKAYFLAHGRSADETDVELVHFRDKYDVARWLSEDWAPAVRGRFRSALDAGVQPVIGLSCYTWNAAELLAVARQVKDDEPRILVVAGGPHVQRAEDFLDHDGIDLVVLGEGERTFTELLDCRSPAEWPQVAGCAYRTENGDVSSTASRPRTTTLDELPSALDVIPLRDAAGKPLYEHVAYETSRGCPYRCSFCEWGTGAIGTKMYQFSLQRIQDDLERLVAGGVQDIWLCDSNFGALREDLEKARMIVDLRRTTGLPRTFATSWSKNHNRRVQEIVRSMHRSGLLPHYNFALQTLTPLALELSHRTNMRANEYEPVVKALAAEGVPICGELIWGLPGDTLGEFEANLDHLLTLFPNVNIFGYTLLPGTEFYERREEYRLETVPVAGYGKAKGEYVVGCHTFPRDEGEEGYFMITAYILLARGHVMPLTTRLLALRGLPVTSLLRAVLRGLVADGFGNPERNGAGEPDRMSLYERRADFYLDILARPAAAYASIDRTLAAWFADRDEPELGRVAARVLAVDRALRPRLGPSRTTTHRFEFQADVVERLLGRMEDIDDRDVTADSPVTLHVRHPGRAGEVLLDPDGGAWMRGHVIGAFGSGAADGIEPPHPSAHPV